MVCGLMVVWFECFGWLGCGLGEDCCVGMGEFGFVDFSLFFFCSDVGRGC